MQKSTQENRKLSQIPSWLWSTSSLLPPLYRRIWESVKESDDIGSRRPGSPGEHLVDTNKVFPLLLTSRLPTEVLGYIWSLANQKYAGQLTEQELYVVLALVAVAQAAYPFNSIDILHLLPVPPVPSLSLDGTGNVVLVAGGLHQNPHPNTHLQHQQQQQQQQLHHHHHHQQQQHHRQHHQQQQLHQQKQPQHSRTDQNAALDSRHSRTNKSSCDESSNKGTLDSSSGDEFSEFQSAPVPSVPSIPVLYESKQGSASIGSRLANHNLGVKKPPEKLKTRNSTTTMTSTPSLTSKRTLSHGSEPAAEQLQFAKCTTAAKTKPKTVILKDTVIRNSDDEVTTKVSQDLMNLQATEDKYSALRVLVDSPPPVMIKSTITAAYAADDFGEFVSAEEERQQPEQEEEEEEGEERREQQNWEQRQQSPPPPTATTTTITRSIDLLTDFEFKLQVAAEEDSGDDRNDESAFVREIIETFNTLEVEGTEQQYQLQQQQQQMQASEEKFGVTGSDNQKSLQREDTVSVNSIDLNNGANGILTRSGSVPSLDLKCFLPSNQDEEQSAENMHELIYWEWKQYMESCVLLLQVAANIFTGIASEEVLEEVLASAQGYNFLCNLAEIAAVCRRVNFSHKEMDINIMGFDDLLLDIDRIWAEMEPFYANIPIVTELPVWPSQQQQQQRENVVATCALCLTVITSGRILHHENNYHATCANLWLNCVNSHLPALKYSYPTNS